MRTIIYKFHKDNTWHDSDWMILNEIIDFYDQKEINQLFSTNITGVVDRYFNPKTINPSLTSIPLEARNAMVENFTHLDRHDESFKFYKFIFFTGYFIDKSGRQPFQFPTNLDYYPIIPGKSGKNNYKENEQYFEDYEHIPNLNNWTLANTNLGFYKGTDKIANEMAWRGNWVAWEDLIEVDSFKLLDGINVGSQVNYGPGEAVFVRNIGMSDIG